MFRCLLPTVISQLTSNLNQNLYDITVDTSYTLQQVLNSMPKGIKLWNSYGGPNYAPATGNAYRNYVSFNSIGAGAWPYNVIYCIDVSNAKVYVTTRTSPTDGTPKWTALN